MKVGFIGLGVGGKLSAAAAKRHGYLVHAEPDLVGDRRPRRGAEGPAT